MTAKPAALLSTLATCLAGCNTPSTIIVDGITVKTSGRAGGQGQLYVQHGSTVIATSDNNEDSFREVAKTARFGIGAIQAAGVIKSGIGAVQSVKNTATAASVSNTAAREATKQAGIAAEQEAARLAAEAAAAESTLILPPLPSP